jgi:hypothetical protein
MINKIRGNIKAKVLGKVNSALARVTGRSEDLKRVPIETWANYFLKVACSKLGIKIRFGVIAAIDCLYAVSISEKFKTRCKNEDIPLIVGLQIALEEFGEKSSEDQSANTAQLKKISDEDIGGIGSVLAIPESDWPKKIQ